MEKIDIQRIIFKLEGELDKHQKEIKSIKNTLKNYKKQLKEIQAGMNQLEFDFGDK